MKNKRTALVTGGAQRIGAAICLKLADLGYNIALHYNTSKQKAQKLAKQIEAKGVACKIFPCDLAKEKGVEQLIPNVRKHCPHLSALVNNASIFKTSSLKKLKRETLHTDFNVHLTAPVILSRDFAKHCKKGSIINITDTHITEYSSAHFSYLLSKKALSAFTQMAAVELAPHIRVNAIAPGLILPPTGAKKGYLQRLAKKIPLKKKGSVENITQSVEFLLTNEYITGQTLFNDGGEHLL